MSMSETELLAVLRSQIGDTTRDADDTLRQSNLELYNRYNLEPYGNEEEGRSQVQSSDVFDTVESDMVAFTRIFQGANKVMEFRPTEGADPEEVEEANQKTEYADFLVRRQHDSFCAINGWMKAAGFTKASILHYYHETVEKPEYVKFEGLSEIELAQTLETLEGEKGVDRVDIESQDEDEGAFNVRFKLVRKRKRIAYSHIPAEDFRITRGSESKDSAPLVGHVTRKTKGELIAEGYDKALIKGLPITGDEKAETRRKRFEDQGGYDKETGYHWTNDKVEVEVLYSLVDYDCDDIPERRHILKIGQHVLENEPFGHVPYAMLSQILVPHSVIGKSRGEQASRYQRRKPLFAGG